MLHVPLYFYFTDFCMARFCRPFLTGLISGPFCVFPVITLSSLRLVSLVIYVHMYHRWNTSRALHFSSFLSKWQPEENGSQPALPSHYVQVCKLYEGIPRSGTDLVHAKLVPLYTSAPKYRHPAPPFFHYKRLFLCRNITTSSLIYF